MLILIPTLPAYETLRSEGYDVVATGSAQPQLRIALVNLMPNKPDTELDFFRLLAPQDTVIEPVLVNMASHRSSHTPQEHIDRFYTPSPQLDLDSIDGVIITGAPLENVRFEDVNYWKEVTDLLDQLAVRSFPTLNVCWGAYAALYHRYRLDWHHRPSKISGVYSHRILRPDSPLMKGVEEGFTIPHSRHVSWDINEVEALSEKIEIIAAGDEQGPYLVSNRHIPEHYITGHGEYTLMTLDNEYRRDMGKGMNPHPPVNYYPDNNPANTPVDTWHTTALMIMRNWLSTINH